MRVDVTIKKGRHSPSLWWRLLHLRIWFRILGKLPHRFIVSGLSIEYLAVFAVNPVSLGVQINKLAGIAYGFPRESKQYGCWIHPNSARIGWTLVSMNGNLLRYQYLDGQRTTFQHTGKITDREIETNMRLGGNRNGYWFAYFLMPYFGGEIPAPCDVRISYDIKFFSE